jgi:hypothetical protein
MNELTQYVKGVVDDKELKRREYEKYNKGSIRDGNRYQFLADKMSRTIMTGSNKTSLTNNDISMFENKEGINSSKKVKNAWLT